jgi:hypothetical protein
METTMLARRRPLILGLSVLIVSALSLRFTGADEKTPVKNDATTTTVPFELLASNHMVVKAKINGKGPFRLVFDLGAPVTLLSNKAAESAGVVKPNTPKFLLFAMRGEGRADSLEIGTLKDKDIPLVVLDHPVLKALAGFLGKPLDGIMGFTFFARYKVTIDYQAKVMSFTKVDYVVKDLMKDLPNRLANPKDAEEIIVAPKAIWGLSLEALRDEHPAGVRIKAVAKDSPAEAAGLKSGDILTTLDGRWTTTLADTFAATADVVAGKSTDVIVVRDNKEVVLKVTPTSGF